MLKGKTYQTGEKSYQQPEYIWVILQLIKTCIMDKTFIKIHSSCLFTNRTYLTARPAGKIRGQPGGRVEREYFIHVPSSYDGSSPVPLVFMLHGTSGNGETYYNAYGWTELADVEGFIAVFPSSGRYKIVEDGVNKTTTKWNTPPDADWTFQQRVMGYDDIKFLRKVVDEMKKTTTLTVKEFI